MRYALLALLIAIGCKPRAQQTATEPTVDMAPRMGEVITEARKGVVQVTCSDSQNNRAMGSGFIVSPTGIILTNRHVVDDCEILTVRVSDEEKPLGVIKLADYKNFDVAVLQLYAWNRETPWPVLYLAGAAPAVGDYVASIGFPGSAGVAYTVAKVLKVDTQGTDTTGALHIDMALLNKGLGGGSSGGPVIDRFGRVIGMNTLGSADDSTSTINSVPQLLYILNQANDMIRYDRKPFAGVATDFRDNATRVTFVNVGGLSEKAGLLAGDTVLTANGERLAGKDTIGKMIDGLQPGMTLKLGILRAGDEMDIDVTKPALPEPKPARKRKRK